MPLGVHNSIAGGLWMAVDRASELGCDAMQMFGRNPRAWAFKPVAKPERDLFIKRREEAGLKTVAVHTTYLINLCAPLDINYDKSVFLFKKELETAEGIDADCLVTHLGSPQDLGTEFAIKRIVQAFKEVKAEGLGKKTMILVENTAGGGYSFGSRLTDIGEILDAAESIGLKAGFCMDTCHAFASGYPITTEDEVDSFVKTIDKEAGLKRLRLIHLNDSRGALNSRLDRHEHIGKGKIGVGGFKALLNHAKLIDIPLILETPKKTPQDDPMNLSAVRKLKGIE